MKYFTPTNPSTTCKNPEHELIELKRDAGNYKAGPGESTALGSTVLDLERLAGR